VEISALDPADGIDRTLITRQGILPFRMPFPRDELRRHERTRPERRALVAPGSSTVKHNSYRRRKLPGSYFGGVPRAAPEGRDSVVSPPVR
jgi:hypothetical protein